MPNWWPFNSDEIKEEGYDVSSAIPIGFGQNNFQSQDIDPESFARDSYNSDAIVYACLRELAVAVTEPNYRVMVDTSTEPTVAPQNNPLARMLQRPNEQQDFYELLEDLITQLYISGNVYLYKVRNQSGRMIGMRLLRPDRISIKSDAVRGVEYYNYRLDGPEYTIPAADIAHMKFPNMSSDLYGLSPLQPAASVINLDQAQIQYGKTAFQNSGVIGGMLKLSRRIQNEEQANQIRSRWRSTFGGNNMHKLAILDEDATYEKVGSTMEELAFPALRDMTESRICMVFGVPPIIVGSVVGLDRATYSNYREARQSFFTETMIPLCERLVRFFNKCFEYEYSNAGYLDADFTNVAALIEDQNKLSDRLIAQWNSGLISLNEARSGLAMDGLSGGDLRRLPLNVLELPSSEIQPTALPTAEQLSASTDIRKRLESQLEPDSPYTPIAGQPMERLLNQEMIAARIDEVNNLIPKLERYYRGMKNRVDGVLGRYLAEPVSEQKSYPFNAEELLPIGAKDDLARILAGSYAGVVRSSFKILNERGGLGILDFDEKLPVVQNVLAQANSQAFIIHGTTQKAIAKTIAQGLENGYSVAQVANGVPDANFRGLKSVVGEDYKNRPRTIARTEMARAQNQSTLGYAASLGSIYSQAFDPDGDVNDTFTDNYDPFGYTCAERHLQIYRNEDAIDIVDHPNGTLAWTPLPSSYEPSNSRLAGRNELGKQIIEVKDTINART
tara:strand:- start:945 stop:3131 length:2187 start_codon:yes stop_codon:yes gene_type:complete